MEYRVFGRTGIKVSVLGFGGAEIGFEKAEQSTVTTLLNEALDAGLNVIDTAMIYDTSEEMIGHAVSSRRDEYHLFTKCGNAMKGNAADLWTSQRIVEDIEQSLRRLQTDCIDLIQLHSCSRKILESSDVIETLETARQIGKCRFIGYSGDNADALYAIETGRFDAVQMSLNIADQSAIDTTLAAAAGRQMGVIAKRPIANAAWKTGSKPANPYHHGYFDRLSKLQYPFLTAPLDEAVSVALRFTLAQTGVHTAIVGTRQPGRWARNAALLESGPLPAEQVEAIRQQWKRVAPESWKALT